MAAGQPYTVGRYTVKQGKENAFKAAWENFARETMKHYRIPGPVKLLQDSEHPQNFVSYGVWSHNNDIKDWAEQNYYREFMQTVRDLCDSYERASYHVAADVPIKAPDFEKVKNKGN